MPEKELRSPLGRVRGLGSAKHGTSHWWLQRLTALALIPLCAWFVVKLLFCLQGGDYAAAVSWLRHPVSAAAMALLLVTGFHHAASGLQVVIEDYVHHESARLAAIIAVKFLAAAMAVIGLVAIGKIAFGS